MKHTLLALSFFSLLACKKEDVSNLNKSDSNKSIINKIESLQSLKDYANLSNQDKTEFLRYLDTCSAESRTHIKAKFESLYHPKTNAKLTASSVVLNDDSVPDVADAWDYLESEVAGGYLWRYFWTVSMPTNGEYMIRSIEKIMVAPVPDPPYYTIHLVLHDHSGLIEGFDQYWYKESSFSNAYWSFTASFHCSGVLGNYQTGFQREVLNFRFVDFGVFIQSNGAQYY